MTEQKNYKQRVKEYLQKKDYNRLTPNERVKANNACFTKIERLVIENKKDNNCSEYQGGSLIK